MEDAGRRSSLAGRGTATADEQAAIDNSCDATPRHGGTGIRQVAGLIFSTCGAATAAEYAPVHVLPKRYSTFFADGDRENTAKTQQKRHIGEYV